ncbi:MAG: IS21 family transposase [Ignavibacteriaceae bacterium]|nr:IS21 family transposase [Ignavibacteriaceae bacterium]
MRKIKEILRLKWESGLSNRAIARACSIGRETVREYLERAAEAGVSWPLPEGLTEEELEHRLFPFEIRLGGERELPDWSEVHRELKRKGVTRRLLWLEYCEEREAPYSYPQFCELYNRWAKKLDPVMRLTHKAGEKLFIDYAGLVIPYVWQAIGEEREAHVFVATLGASSYIYAEAQSSQAMDSWIGAHVRAFEFFGGVPEILVPDNTKTGITSPCRYEPDINPTYQEMAEHYGAAVIPARVRHPRDKAKVESGVQVVEYWVIAPLRKRQFFSIEEINQALWEKLSELNTREMRHLGKSRQELFEELDKPALKPLPERAYELAEWKRAKVSIDYHLEYAGHYYSVPYLLIHKDVNIRATENVIEVFSKGKRVASHKRDDSKGRHSTLAEHMPESHRLYGEWNPERFIRWAERSGSATAEMVRALLCARRHLEQGYRSSLGLLRLESRYGKERLEAACQRALSFGLHSYKGVKNILEAGLDKVTREEPLSVSAKAHLNIRGTKYYS